VSGGHVLVIEDDPKIAGLLQRGLSLKGLEVTVAEDGAAGRVAWNSGAFDVVLLDVMLPEVDGLSLCAERRATGDRTPVVLLSARDDDQTRERAAACDVADYVTKPFAYADLMARVMLQLAPSDAS
jgi:DNA-binding response OmpR family regulator